MEKQHGSAGGSVAFLRLQGPCFNPVLRLLSVWSFTLRLCGVFWVLCFPPTSQKKQKMDQPNLIVQIVCKCVHCALQSSVYSYSYSILYSSVLYNYILFYILFPFSHFCCVLFLTVLHNLTFFAIAITCLLCYYPCYWMMFEISLRINKLYV